MKKLLFLLVLLFTGTAYAQQATTDSLALFRAQIDSLDQQTIRLLARRMDVVRRVGAYKLRQNLEVVQPARFEAMVRRNAAYAAPLGLSGAFIAELMHAIHTESIAIQQRLAEAKN
jgi:chorismate mutase